MRFGKYVSIEILEDMIHYCRRMDELEKKLYNADTFKGKEHIWADKLPSNNYVLYGSASKRWYAEYFDWEGNWLGMYDSTEPFDYREKEKELTKK